MECVARNPCKQCKRNQNPDGVTEFCRAFGTYFLVADFSRGSFSATLRKRLLRRRASLRFTTCLYSCQAFGLLPAGCSLLFGQTTSPSPSERRVAKRSARTMTNTRSALHAHRDLNHSKLRAALLNLLNRSKPCPQWVTSAHAPSSSPLLYGRRLGSLEQPPVWLRPHQGERIPHSRRRSWGWVFSSQ